MSEQEQTNEEIVEILQNRLRRARIRAGLNEEQVAAELGVVRQYYNDVERGLRTPSARLLAKCAALYGVSVDYLIHGNGEGAKSKRVCTKRNRSCFRLSDKNKSEGKDEEK